MRSSTRQWLLAGLAAAIPAIAAADLPDCAAREWSVETRSAWVEASVGTADAAMALVNCLDDPLPAVRDEFALGTLTAWLRGGQIDHPTRQALATRLIRQLRGAPDPDGFRHPFAAMALAEVARSDRLDPVFAAEELEELVTVATRYLQGISDYRGWHPQQGWRHAVAHGADLVLQLGLHPRLDAEAQHRLLAALATKIAPADAPDYVAGEPERLARAVHYLHARGLLDENEQDAWLKALLETAPADSDTAAYLTWRHNLLAFLQALGYAARAAGQSERAQAIDEIAGPLLGV